MLRRRNFLRAAGVGALTGLAGCGRSDGDLRLGLCNHVWTTAIRERIGEFEDLAHRRVLVSTMTADQLSSTYNVKLNASAPDVDVMMYRPLQEQLLFARNGWLADLTDLVAGEAAYDWSDVQEGARERVTTEDRVFGVPIFAQGKAAFPHAPEPPHRLRRGRVPPRDGELDHRGRGLDGTVRPVRGAGGVGDRAVRDAPGRWLGADRPHHPGDTGASWRWRATCATMSSRSYTFSGGYLHPGETAGIGVTVDKEAAARFEYRPAYLPANRLRDGTVHDW